ncbi:hypothetical protein IL54_3257 [Sphingobium sp. ba1]|nr:hypothetical protein IL54_3257 [Sphingobium sp. ba1]
MDIWLETTETPLMRGEGGAWQGAIMRPMLPIANIGMGSDG